MSIRSTIVLAVEREVGNQLLVDAKDKLKDHDHDLNLIRESLDDDGGEYLVLCIKHVKKGLEYPYFEFLESFVQKLENEGIEYDYIIQNHTGNGNEIDVRNNDLNILEIETRITW